MKRNGTADDHQVNINVGVNVGVNALGVAVNAFSKIPHLGTVSIARGFTLR